MKKEKMDDRFRNSLLYRFKELLDSLLIIILIVIPVYLYADFVATSGSLLYKLKKPLQLSILVYFVAELGVSFVLYEENREFFRDRWMDLILTVPFFAAFRGIGKLLKGLKMLKAGKTVKAGKILKGAKLGQKIGKMFTKGRKLKDRRSREKE
jgi:hypothetical protein